MTTMTGIQTLCWNCDGEVDVEADNCPYCGVDLQQRAAGDSVEEPVSEAEVPVHTSPYQTVTPQETSFEAPPLEPGSLSSVLLPMGLLLPGAVFLLFALVLLLFGEEGHFTLSWSTAYWPLYLVLSLPLLYCGWHALERVPD